MKHLIKYTLFLSFLLLANVNGYTQLKNGETIILTGKGKFELGKKHLTPGFKTELDSFALIFTNQDSLCIEIGVHDDIRGFKYSSTNLSQKRAQEIKDYLIQQGVEACQLTARGYSDSKPIYTQRLIDSFTDSTKIQEAYAQNFRIELKVKSDDFLENRKSYTLTKTDSLLLANTWDTVRQQLLIPDGSTFAYNNLINCEITGDSAFQQLISKGELGKRGIKLFENGKFYQDILEHQAPIFGVFTYENEDYSTYPMYTVVYQLEEISTKDNTEGIRILLLFEFKKVENQLLLTNIIKT